MNFALTEEEKAFQREIRGFLDREVTRDLVEEVESGIGIGPRVRELLHKMGQRGWLTPQWPREYGGLNGTHIQKLIAYDEIRYHYAMKGALVGAAQVGPTILRFGTEEQKGKYLLPIARGEIHFALGYTEPQAGSDLARLEVRAVESGDHYVMNGQKIYSSSAHCAEYHWIGARTDPSAPKHRGISLFIVDLKSPGITIRPLYTQDGRRTNEVFYDDVRVPKKNLVGEKNRGFYHIAVALDLERMLPTGDLQRFFDDLLAYIKGAPVTGKDLGNDVLVRQRMAEMALELEVARLLSYRLAWLETKGMVPNYEASMQKVYVTELKHRLARTALQILKLYGQLTRDSKWAQLRGKAREFFLESFYDTIAGGTSEIQRNIIATRGLGMPRS